MSVAKMCHNCGVAQVWARHRCHACLKYLQRHGEERPEHLCERQLQLNYWRHGRAKYRNA
jgi:hypothetical protein